MMFRSAATRRVGVLAYTLRAREYARRVFRSLGYAPLVFTSLDELAALGPSASTLDALLVGDAPLANPVGRPVLDAVRELVGLRVPVLCFRLRNEGAENPIPVSDNGWLFASPRFFGDFCIETLSFLDAVGLERPHPRLAWDAYSFDPLYRAVGFANWEVRLDAVAFDVALELFFRAGSTVTKYTLTSMLPDDEEGLLRRRIDNLGSVIKEVRAALRLRGKYGWSLETLPHAGYRMARVESAPSETRSLEVAAR